MPSEALKAIIAAKRAAPDQTALSIDELRAASAAAARSIPLPERTKWRPVAANDVPCEWIDAPGVRRDKVFLFIHGGGYYRGSVAISRATAANIGVATNARCLSVDYRLAPEHPYPAAIDDCLAAYRWLLDEGIAATNVVVGGVSAGGGLTLALLIGARDAGLPLPAAAVAMSAWTDLTQSGESYQTRAEADPVISKAYLDHSAHLYLGDADPLQALASPLFADLSGLPPLLLQVGTAETMMDDSVRFVERAHEAGVSAVVEPWDDMFHGWHGSAHILPEAQQAIDRIGEFFGQHA